MTVLEERGSGGPATRLLIYLVLKLTYGYFQFKEAFIQGSLTQLPSWELHKPCGNNNLPELSDFFLKKISFIKK